MSNNKQAKMDLRLIVVCMLIGTQILFAQISTWESRGIGGGGALFFPQVNPHNTSELYIACDMSDLFHTKNAGLSWEIVHFKSLSAGSMTGIRFTSDPNVLYTRDFDMATYTWFPVKSEDGGMTWKPLPADPTNGQTYYVYADYKSTSRLIATSYNDVYFSNDAGSAWKKIYSNASSDAAYVSGVFWDSTKIFIGTSRGLLVSTDNGSTFAIAAFPGIPSTDGMFSFTGARYRDTIRLFCITGASSDLWPGVTGAEYQKYKDILKLDYGISPGWVSCKSSVPSNRYFFFIAMAQNNCSAAYIAGGDTEWGFPAVFKTVDGGAAWTDVFLTKDNQNIITGWAGNKGDYDFWWGGYALGFTVCGNNPDIAVLTDLGYPHMTTDGGKLWRQMYVSAADENPAGAVTPKGKYYRGIGMENTGCWDICWIDSLTMFAGYSDIAATRSTDGGVSWSKKYSGLTTNTIYKILRHPQNGNVYATTSSHHELYESIGLTDNVNNGTGGVFVSADKGSTWDTVHIFNMPVVWIAFDPRDYKTMYASVVHSVNGGIYVSHDIDKGKGSTWSKLAAPPRTEGHANSIYVLNDGTLVCSYSARYADGTGFTKSSGVFKSIDNGITWTDCSGAGLLYWTRDLIIDTHDPQQNIWYACVYSGWGGAPNTLGGLYRTKDRGNSWQRISALYRVGSCTNHPDSAEILYVATEDDGLWYTKNLRSDAPTFTLVDNYRFAHPQRIFFNRYLKNEVWTTSSGYGITRGIESPVPIQSKKESVNNKALQWYYNPVTRLLHLQFYRSMPSTFTLKLYDLKGKEIAVLMDRNTLHQSLFHIEIPVRIKAGGVYCIRGDDGALRFTQKIVLVHTGY